MSFDTQGRLTDPRALRAVAHPARLGILDLLQLQESATATQCAAHVGLSPSACSYHLRSLAKWGLIEEAEGGRGRERPWRAKVSRIRVEEAALGSGSAHAAGDLFRAQLVASGEQWVRDFLRRRRDMPEELRHASVIDNRTLALTAAEARELWTRVDALVSEYEYADRAEQPPGALPFRWLLRAFPADVPEQGPSG